MESSVSINVPYFIAEALKIRSLTTVVHSLYTNLVSVARKIYFIIVSEGFEIHVRLLLLTCLTTGRNVQPNVTRSIKLYTAQHSG